MTVGDSLGALDCSLLGLFVGNCHGFKLEFNVCCNVGTTDETVDGIFDGSFDATSVGFNDSDILGTRVGEFVSP